jgi:membrane protein
LKISRRRLRPSILFLAVGITLLNTVGRYYVVRTERNPAYTVVAGAVGLLLYLYLLNQLLLFGAAIAATSDHGRVVDLAGGEPPSIGETSEQPGPTGARDGADAPDADAEIDPEADVGPDDEEHGGTSVR